MSSFIMENALFGESKIVHSTPGKAIFRNVIQTVDEINQNKRLYPKTVLESGMQGTVDRMKRRALMSELDHPFPQGNQSFDQVRQTTVSLKEVSHIIKNYDFKGNHLVAEMETTKTPNGAILLGLLRDKVGLGFSMRGMAELERLQDHNLVKAPLTVIAFDAVSSPSHKSAVVDFNEMKFESHMLTESCGQVCVGEHCYLPDYFDKLVETKMIQFFDSWI